MIIKEQLYGYCELDSLVTIPKVLKNVLLIAQTSQVPLSNFNSPYMRGDFLEFCFYFFSYYDVVIQCIANKWFF